MRAGCSHRHAWDPISRIVLFSAVAHLGETPTFQTCVILKYRRSGSIFDRASSHFRPGLVIEYSGVLLTFRCMYDLAVKKAMSG